MSLLPGQIIPQSIPIGKTANGDMVSIDHNWWLFFYNLALGTLSPTPGGTAVSDMEKILLNEIDSRVNDTTGGGGGGGGFTNPMTTKGDIIFENATPAPDRLGIGSDGDILISSSGLPIWSNPNNTTFYHGAGAYTYSVPAGASKLTLLLFGCGGNGGNGYGGAVLAGGGGGGGGSGSMSIVVIPTLFLPSTLYVFLNSGSVYATSYVDIANDTGGSVTGNCLMYAVGGNNGGNGTSSGGGSGGTQGLSPTIANMPLAQSGSYYLIAAQAGGGGISSYSTALLYPANPYMSGGGGGGKSLNTPYTAGNPGTGIAAYGSSTLFTGVAVSVGGTNPCGNGTNGGNGADYFGNHVYNTGAEGGAGSGWNSTGNTNCGSGGTGGNGGYGSGAGGGGAGFTAGSGGTGGDPACLILAN